MPELKITPEIIANTSQEKRREVIDDLLIEIREIVKDVTVGGVRGGVLDGNVDSFMSCLEQELIRVSNKGEQDEKILSVLPTHVEDIKRISKEALKVHVVGFFRSNKKELFGTIFDTNESQHSLDEYKKISLARRLYIQGFIASLLEHAHIVSEDNSFDKTVLNLSKYYSPEFSEEYFFGDYILNKINEGEYAENFWTREEVEKLFTHHFRRYFVSGFIKSLDSTLKKVAKNYKLLNTDYIYELLGSDFSKEEIEKLWTPQIKMDSAVGNINSVDESVKQIGMNYKILTTDYIYEILGEDFSKKDIEKLWTPQIKMYFAINNIKSLKKGILDWKNGKTTISIGSYEKFLKNKVN